MRSQLAESEGGTYRPTELSRPARQDEKMIKFIARVAEW